MDGADRQEEHRRHHEAGEDHREPETRLLALDDQGHREDRVREEDHHHDADRADRHDRRLVHDRPHAERDPDQDQTAIQQEQPDPERHPAVRSRYDARLGRCVLVTHG